MQRTPTCENCQRNYELRDFRPIGPRIPLLLSCGHTFCEGCLLKVAKLKPEIKCFKCESLIHLEPNGEAGVKNLVPNIYLLGILLYNRRLALGSLERKPGGSVSTFNGIGNVLRQKKLSPISYSEGAKSELHSEEQDVHNEETQILCDECSTKHATCQCNNCDSNKFCDACFSKIHQASKMLNKHSPLPLGYPSTEELSCSMHGRPLEFYDKDLNESVCAMCVISDSCKGHCIIPISQLQNKLNEELESAAEKVKDVFGWLSHSNKVLTAVLPREVMEADDLFLEIHEKFTVCHTLLLKRQIELMNEASESLLKNGSTNSMLQKLSKHTRDISTVLKDYEMVKSDARAMHLKSNEFLEKFKEYTEVPCIIQAVPLDGDSSVGFEVLDSTVTTIKTLGHIEENTANMYILKAIDEITDNEKEQLKSAHRNPPLDEAYKLKENEILDEQIPLDKSRIKTSKLSLMSGYHELVYVTYIKNPLDFQVQRAADKDRLHVLMTALNKYCRHSTSVEDLAYTTEEGQLLCAQFIADNNWYRARVINAMSNVCPDVVPTWQNGLCVEVLYVDYGNTEWLPLNRLRQLKNQFLEVPEMAVPCSLTDIVPPSREEVWPKHSIKALTSLTGDRPMLMNIRKRVGGKLYVDLRRPEDEEFKVLHDNRPISVRDALVFLEVAVFFSPASHPNADVHKSSQPFDEPDPLQKDVYIDITLTHVENPHCLFIQRLDSPIVVEQEHLRKLYSGRDAKAWKVDCPHRNLVCAAKFSVDQTWYRAVVKNVNHIEETVDVLFVDYGNMETAKFSDIKNIPPMYLTMPKQCWQVKLHDVDLLDSSDEWHPDSLLILENCLNKPYVALVKDIDDQGKASIEVFDTSTAEDININQVLIKKGVVKGVGKSADLVIQVEEGNNAASHQTPENLSVSDTCKNVEQDDATLESLRPAIEERVIVPDKSVAQYSPIVRPAKNTFGATGIFVDENAIIYLHVFGVADIIQKIMWKLNEKTAVGKYNVHPTTTAELSLGQACIGKYSADGLWYRVEISEIIDDQKLRALFIDFGNSEETTVNHLFMEGRFVDVPGQCISVKLGDIEPNTENKCWSKQAIKLLETNIEGQNIRVKMKPGKNNRAPFQVELKLPNKSDMAKKLISQNLATPVNVKKNLGVESHIAFDRNYLSSASSSDVNPISPTLSATASDVELDVRLRPVTAVQDPVQVIPPFPIQPQIHHSAYLWYTEQALPAKGVPFDVQVTQVNQPDLVYIQRNPPNDDELLFADDKSDKSAAQAYVEIDELYAISDYLNSDEYLNNSRMTLPDLQIGMACVCRYTNDDLFYRARVENTSKDKETVDVTYVDYGNAETVPIERLKPLPRDLVGLPMQSSLVRIAGVKPLKNDECTRPSEGDSDWSCDARKNFFAMVANKRMIAQVVCGVYQQQGTSDFTPKIHLYDRCLMEDSETGETNDVLIGNVMAENNIAEFELSIEEANYALL